MDRRERLDDGEEALRAALDARQAAMRTAEPGIIQSFDADAQTAVVQLSIQGVQTAPDGTKTLVDLKPLLDCPVQFPSGGGASLTFPVKQGDECLVVFSGRGVDFWHQSGGVQPPVAGRMHSLSDGFVLLGVRSKPRALSGISTTATELRSDDGSTVVQLNPTAQTVKVTAPGGFMVEGGAHVTGDLTVDGTGVFQDASFDNLTANTLTVASLAG